MLWQDQVCDALEPSTNNVNFSRSAALANHMLAFTVKLPGKSPNEFFESSSFSFLTPPLFGNIFFNKVSNPPVVSIPPQVSDDTPLGMLDSNIRRFEKDSSFIHSDWAEVAYFLGPHNAGVVVADGNTDGKDNPPALPYYNLYRQQRLVLPSYNIAGVALPPAGANEEISCELATFSFNKPSDLTVPWKRMGNRTLNGLTANRYLGKPPANTPLFSEYTSATKVNTDIIATNVISFDVKFITDDYYDYETLNAILNRAPYLLNPAYSPSVSNLFFDTWTTDQGNAANSIPKYDLGEWNTIPNKWQPSIPVSSATIPVWGWYLASTMPNVYKPYKGLNIKAVQISLRIWDQKSNTAKMFVVVQKL